ncbi:response regulator [Pseudomonas fulva]|uniref:response regulator n=2 Tax=Pseudomonas TaxID=286 RepID=UPI00071FA7C6|nr:MULTISPECIES: response regulator [Pseudomonas]AVF55232.1 response regulator [Pseudomonas fulva]MBA1206247.1 response regulator [Pseudomonas fulva]MBA1215522.1 response regulator [Pseudomonas fulva]MBH3363067.1 response regulator [Pseudomonas sp. URMO17WK12:I11]MDH0570693.1 response regulator [Pseudomonas fulva]
MSLLVVEDDDIVRMLMVEVLDELKYDVIEAQDATTAQKVLENPDQTLELMITDVGLPDMDGHDLAKRARVLRPGLPVLFASGYGDNVEVPEGMYRIGKPYSIDQLRDKVASILDAHQAG